MVLDVDVEGGRVKEKRGGTGLRVRYSEKGRGTVYVS